MSNPPLTCLDCGGPLINLRKSNDQSCLPFRCRNTDYWMNKAKSLEVERNTQDAELRALKELVYRMGLELNPKGRDAAAWLRYYGMSVETSPDRDAAVRELVDAVNALPVEEWVEPRTVVRPDGSHDVEPELVGYVMQAQGEWDRVRRALKAVQPRQRGER